jgi:Zn-dependent M28 family amino/carboxypeptidase
VVISALREAGLDPFEQPAPVCQGSNILATIPGDVARWVLVAAHYDHLGRLGDDVFWGADDNAAAVAILVEVGQSLARHPPQGRGVILASFDGEEAPFESGTMGSQHFVRYPSVPLDRIDMMICMDLVGHALGPAEGPSEVSGSLFVLGGERSQGTAAHLARLSRSEEGLWVRGLDAEVIPPVSDYVDFWRRQRPFVFLTSGRSRVYHTPQDTPDKLDCPKMARTARWLERFVRETCAREEERIAFLEGVFDDALSLRTLIDLTSALVPLTPEAEMAREHAQILLARCNTQGRLPDAMREEVRKLIRAIEQKLG